MKSNILKNFCIFLIISLITGLFLYMKPSKQEGFGPRWLRTRKNRMFRGIRKTLRPYYNNYFKKLERFRRKWL